MGAVRMRDQTADNNTSNPHHSSPSIKAKSCVFVRNNSILTPKGILTLNHRFWQKHESNPQ